MSNKRNRMKTSMDVSAGKQNGLTRDISKSSCGTGTKKDHKDKKGSSMVMPRMTPQPFDG